MSERDPRSYLVDVRTAIDRVMSFTEGLDFEAYRSDRLRQDAVERNLITIGEAIVRLRRDYPEIAAKIPPAARIIALRNILVHVYTSIDQERVWQVVTQHLSVLRSVAESLLAQGWDE